ncbi:MAG: hypothetical protein LBQ98_03670 [Nitrososphaerota archaeon]|jgi:hypothetical protein|nr:hypothetical protein [Nitrososphaerota archaeon]
MVSVSNGDCRICGVKLGKTAMKNHVLKKHADEANGEVCGLFKIEGAYNKNYWLLVDVAIDKPLSVLDSFLRQIWLECCEHLSAFRVGNSEIEKNRKISSLPIGAIFTHEYDFGSTTELLITIVAGVRRPKQRDAVRLLARNTPPVRTCVKCGASATQICTECMYDSENPFFCDACCEEHNEIHECALPAVNSPRMGVCGYDGEHDVWDI